MRYFKITDAAGNLTAVERILQPRFVRWQQRNGILVLCNETVAQGVLAADGSVAYQLEGREALPGDRLTATAITETDYDNMIRDVPDPEDATPEIPKETTEDAVLTRAQLTAKVSELEEALELILSGVTE